MRTRIGKYHWWRWPGVFLLAMALLAVLACCNVCAQPADDAVQNDAFETMRSHITRWLAEQVKTDPLITAATLQDTILNAWLQRGAEFEIVSLRRPEHFHIAGHIHHATNVYWVDMLRADNLKRLHSGKTLVFYCYTGHASMIAYTIYELLGYPCKSLAFGMMDWNHDALVKDPWDRTAVYALETVPRTASVGHRPPFVSGRGDDPADLILAAARAYLTSDGSPIIRAKQVHTLIDGWSEKENEYQIVDIRSSRDYALGHIPYAINIPLPELVSREKLAMLDPAKSLIVYSENGQLGQLAATVLNLLGYRCRNLLFGMMDWNSNSVGDADCWDGTASYAVEVTDTAAKTDEATIAHLIRLELRFSDAVLRGDLADVEMLLASDFVGVDWRGTEFSREEVLANLRDPGRQVESLSHEDIRVHLFGNCAVVHAVTVVEWRQAGDAVSGVYPYVRVWIRRDGRWLAVATHSTAG